MPLPIIHSARHYLLILIKAAKAPGLDTSMICGKEAKGAGDQNEKTRVILEFERVDKSKGN